MFLHVCVILFTGGGLPQCMLGYQWLIYIVKFWMCAPPPRGSKFFQFHAVFGKIWQNRMLAPPLESWCPHLGEILDPPLDTPGGDPLWEQNPSGPGTPHWSRACWEIRSTSGRYIASYWNVILFCSSYSYIIIAADSDVCCLLKALKASVFVMRKCRVVFS